jgi:hypothetical protein
MHLKGDCRWCDQGLGQEVFFEWLLDECRANLLLFSLHADTITFDRKLRLARFLESCHLRLGLGSAQQKNM